MFTEAIPYPMYQPAVRVITSITNSYPATVTTGAIDYPGGILTITPFVNQYTDGMIIRLVIPDNYGMSQANLKSGTITIVDDSTFTIDIDTRLTDPFTIPLPRVLLGGSVSLEQYA